MSKKATADRTISHHDSNYYEDISGAVAAAWVAEGLPALVSIPSATRCGIKSCRAIPFIRIVTADGPTNLCLCHFQSVKERARRIEPELTSVRVKRLLR